MLNKLRGLFTARTDQQEAYDSGFIAGVLAVTGLAFLHAAFDRHRERSS
jgi:hypothetical protein